MNRDDAPPEPPPNFYDGFDGPASPRKKRPSKAVTLKVLPDGYARFAELVDLAGLVEAGPTAKSERAALVSAFLRDPELMEAMGERMLQDPAGVESLLQELKAVQFMGGTVGRIRALFKTEAKAAAERRAARGRKAAADAKKKASDARKAASEERRKAKEAEREPFDGDHPDPDAGHDPDALDIVLRPYTDLGNAERLQHLHGPSMRWCSDFGMWLAWTGTHWKVDKDQDTRLWCYDTVRRIEEEIDPRLDMARAAAKLACVPFDEDAELEAVTKSVRGHMRSSENAPKVDSMLRQARPFFDLRAPVELLDQGQMLLNVRNGTLDLETGKLRPHSRPDLITRVAPMTYDPAAKCPRWEEFIDTTFGGDRELIEFMQRTLGYSLTGDVSEQVIFILLGDGSNGKSTLIETITEPMGDYAQAAPRGMLTVSKNGQSDRHLTEVARLQGARIVTAMETAEGIRINEPLIKQLSGGDTVAANFMHKDHFNFKPSHKMFMATNHKPLIKGKDHGIWRRIRLVPFDVKIEDADMDKGLKGKLAKERSGILNWMLQGCADWRRDGLGLPSAINKAGKAYRAEMDVLKLFLDEMMDQETDPVKRLETRINNGVFAEIYKRWMFDNGEVPQASRPLGRALKAKGFPTSSSNGKSWRFGLSPK